MAAIFRYRRLPGIRVGVSTLYMSKFNRYIITNYSILMCFYSCKLSQSGEFSYSTNNHSLYKVTAPGDQPQLNIKTTSVRDAGLYKCTVSYQAGLKITKYTNLTIQCKYKL